MRPPPEAQYICDGMVTCMDVTADVGAYLNMFYRGNWDWYDNLPNNQRFHQASENMFSRWFASAPVLHRHVCMSAGVSMWNQHLPDIVRDIIKESVRPHHKKLLKSRGEKTLFSSGNIRKAIRKSVRVAKARDVYSRFALRYNFSDQNLLDGFREGQRILLNLSNINEERRRRNYASYHLNWKAKRRIKQDRKRNVKAVTMLRKIAGSDTTRVYIGGDKIVLRGNLLEYHITKNNFQSDHWSGNTMHLYDLEGNFLCANCVYFEGTLAAEQIAGFILYIQTGLEEELINNGNLHSFSEVGREHPVILKAMKGKEVPPGIGPFDIQEFHGEYVTMNNIECAIDREIDSALYQGRLGMNHLVNKYDTRKFRKIIIQELMRDPLFRKINRYSNLLMPFREGLFARDCIEDTGYGYMLDDDSDVPEAREQYNIIQSNAREAVNRMINRMENINELTAYIDGDILL